MSAENSVWWGFDVLHFQAKENSNVFVVCLQESHFLSLSNDLMK